MEFYESLRAATPDLDRLAAFSGSLRGHLGRIRRNPGPWQTVEGLRAVQRLLDEVRISMRVEVDGESPRTARDALLYMQRPRFVGSAHHAWLMAREERAWTDKRVLRTVDRLLQDAAALDVPLWPSQLAASESEQAAWYVQGHTDVRPGEDEFHLGLCVQIGHAVHRALPWACWSVIDGMVERAGEATGYPLRQFVALPGEYELQPGCREYDPEDDGVKPVRQVPSERRRETDGLLRYFGVGEAVEPRGDADV